MAYVRLSVVQPRRGEAARVEHIMRELADSARTTPGCTASYLLKAHDDSGEIARIAIYDDEAAADKVANSQHILSLRSELHLLIEAHHVERGFSSI
jgi:quinol monooxygenase YgiN